MWGQKITTSESLFIWQQSLYNCFVYKNMQMKLWPQRRGKAVFFTWSKRNVAGNNTMSQGLAELPVERVFPKMPADQSSKLIKIQKKKRSVIKYSDQKAVIRKRISPGCKSSMAAFTAPERITLCTRI